MRCSTHNKLTHTHTRTQAKQAQPAKEAGPAEPPRTTAPLSSVPPPTSQAQTQAAAPTADTTTTTTATAAVDVFPANMSIAQRAALAGVFEVRVCVCVCVVCVCVHPKKPVQSCEVERCIRVDAFFGVTDAKNEEVKTHSSSLFIHAHSSTHTYTQASSQALRHPNHSQPLRHSLTAATQHHR